MRTMIFVLLCFACVCATTEAVDTPRLIAHWTFDDASLVGGQYLDETGTYPASVVGSTFSSGPGVFGQAIRFNGTNNYLNVGAGSDPEMRFESTNMCTVIAWIKTDTWGTDGWTGVVTKGDSSWQLSRHGSEPQIRWRARSSINGLTPVNDNNWRMVVGTFDRFSDKLYIDGLVDVEQTYPVPSNIDKNSNAVRIGAVDGMTGRFFNGWMDDVRIYNYALTREEIGQMYYDVTGRLVSVYGIPYPWDGDIEIDPGVTLSWDPPAGEISNLSFDVYFGTEKALVDAGDSSVFKGNQETLTYTPASLLDCGTTYYWKINVHNRGEVDYGTTLQFTTKLIVVTNSAPADGAIDVNPAAILSWDPPAVGGLTGISYDVYFGTSKVAVDAGAGSVFKGNQEETYFVPVADLACSTKYYWRIDVRASGVSGALPGHTCHFLTQPELSPVDKEILIPENGQKLIWLGSDTAQSYNVYFGTDYDSVAEAEGRLVGMDELALFGEYWLNAAVPGELAFLNPDGALDFAEFSTLASYWGENLTLRSNQTGTTFDPGPLERGTTYFWRIDEIDSSQQVTPGDVLSFTTSNTEWNKISIQQKIIDFWSSKVSATSSLEEDYDLTNDPTNIHAGQYSNNWPMIEQNYDYFFAYLYTEPRSTWYHDPELLTRILNHLDYCTRAQGKNGNFAGSKEPTFAGVKKPTGGNGTRTDAYEAVTGFVGYTIGRAIVLLQDEPAFVDALDVLIDNNGDGVKNITRRNAYKAMFDDTKKYNSYTYMKGLIYALTSGPYGNGGAPNQVMGAMAAVQACNEAYKFLNNGTGYFTQSQLDTFRDQKLVRGAGQPSREPWFSDNYMVLEHGYTDYGYDTGYGQICLQMLGAYANNANDTVVKDFITNFMEGYQYFYTIDDRFDKGGYQEEVVRRRSGGGFLLFVPGMTQAYHPALQTMFAAAMNKFDGGDQFYNGYSAPKTFHSIACTPSIVDTLLNWPPAVDSGYVLPCDRPDTFTYTDLQANCEVIKTGATPKTVTWKGFNFDGKLKTHNCPAPLGTYEVTVNQPTGLTSVSEAGATTDTYTLVLTSQPSADVTITVNPDDRTEVNSNGAGNPVQITFTPGNYSTPQTVSVSAIDDEVFQGITSASTITHTAASSDSNYNGIGIHNVVVEVIDDDFPAPTVVGVGSSASSSFFPITPALPSGLEHKKDILLLFVETANQAVSISDQNGGTWTEVTNSPQYTGTAGGTSATRLTAFWSRYNGIQGSPTVADSGNHQIGRIIAVRGAAAHGDPWDVTSGGSQATASTSGSIPGATTTVKNALVVLAIAAALPDSTSTANFSGWANAGLTSVTEHADAAGSSGNGGALGIATGVKSGPGTYGNTTLTLTTSSTQAMMSIALRGGN